jgi:hypothetical protein
VAEPESNAQRWAPVTTSKPRITPPGMSTCTLSATRPPMTMVVPATVGAEVRV